MSVFKEELHVLEKLARQQKQIYPDACDFGVILNDEMKEDIRRVVKSLRGLRSYKVHKWGNWRRDFSFGSSIEVFIAFENDRGMFNGTLVQIDCHVDKKHKLEFATITMSAAVRATA